mmetsp:Transcript_27109/g.66855  ORF Transcript_27109/g.66855 Transcript_27109/m.66855 type:complete len:119 (-) Transcript_27109:5-361(-)
MRDVHTYADGDFFLVPKSAVFELRGYAELALPILIDSLLTVAAVALGLRQQIFMPPACIFHQYHEQGAMPRRVAETVGEKDIQDFISNVTAMLATGTPIVVNDESWGFAGLEFEEHHV